MGDTFNEWVRRTGGRVAVLAFGLALAGCQVSSERAKAAAETSGLSDVVPGNPTPLGCSKSDMMFGRHVTATNANGQRVEALVCCGVLKSCTVRF